eukprot:scaffold165472_cov21-Prasinocladus_malaysianus.AAC.1
MLGVERHLPHASLRPFRRQHDALHLDLADRLRQPPPQRRVSMPESHNQGPSNNQPSHNF